MLTQPDEPRGTCVLCQRRDPYRPNACDACRSWLAGLIGDIRILTEQLAADPPPIADQRAVPVHDRRGSPVPLRDPVITRLPAAAVPGQATGPQIGHSIPESSPPTPLDPIDLTRPAWHGSRGPHARGVLGVDEDQIGHLSVATTLDTWARDWIEVRQRSEHRPEPDVASLTRWLSHRVEWACDEHPGVDEFADELRGLRSTLNRITGNSDWPVRKDAPCPKCDATDLHVRNGSSWIECGTCGRLLSPDEYAQWTKDLAGAKRQAA